MIDAVVERLKAEGQPSLTPVERKRLFAAVPDLLVAGHRPELLVDAIARSPVRTGPGIELEIGKATRGGNQQSLNRKNAAAAERWLEAQATER